MNCPAIPHATHHWHFQKSMCSVCGHVFCMWPCGLRSVCVVAVSLIVCISYVETLAVPFAYSTCSAFSSNLIPTFFFLLQWDELGISFPAQKIVLLAPAGPHLVLLRKIAFFPLLGRICEKHNVTEVCTQMYSAPSFPVPLYFLTKGAL